MYCTKCGKLLADDSRSCDGCGAELTPRPQKEMEPETVSAAPAPAPSPAAVPESDNTTYSAPTAVPETKPGPLSVIGGAVKDWFSSFGRSFKQPVKLIPAIVLAVVWVVLAVLRACGVFPIPAQVVSFITFGEGGLHGGVFGLIGGIIGKGVLAGAVTSLVLALIGKGRKASPVSMLKGVFGLSLGTLWPYLTGAGAAVFIFLFFSGGWTRVTFMAGAGAAYLAARDGLRGGFVTRLLRSFTKKGTGGRNDGASAALRGMTVGFAGAALLGLIGSSLVLIITGGVLLLVGSIMTILQTAGVIHIGKEKAA